MRLKCLPAHSGESTSVSRLTGLNSYQSPVRIASRLTKSSALAIFQSVGNFADALTAIALA